MAFGVLEDRQTPRPIGTVLLYEQDEAHDPSKPAHRQWKTEKGIILQPQPRDSPNDPLNWSLKTKILILVSVMLFVTAMGVIVAIIGVGGLVLADKYHKDYPTVIQIVGPPGAVAAAIMLFISSACTAVYGKRVQFVIAIIGLWLTLLVGIVAKSLNYYMVLKVFQSIFMAPYELLLPALVDDLTYVHQGGQLMGLSALVFIIGSGGSQVISGNIIRKLGIKYVYVVSFCVVALFIPVIYFQVWETSYPRPRLSPISMTDAHEGNFSYEFTDAVDNPPPDTKELDVAVSSSASQDNLSIEANSALEHRHTLRQRLVVFRGRVTTRKFWKALIEPIPLFSYPAVFFGTIMNGAYLTWMTTNAVLIQQVLHGPPYNLRPDQLAYVALPGSGMNLIGSIVGGLLSDYLIKALSKRNKGIYEPEFRILMMIPAFIFSTAGFLAMGRVFAAESSVVTMVATSVLFPLAMPFATLATVPYIYDTMHSASIEGFVYILVFRHMFIFIVINNIPMWFHNAGPMKVHDTLMYINFAVSALAIPVYVYGKRMRGAIYRSPRWRSYSQII